MLDGKGWRVLRRGLAKSRDERYGSCRELVEALQAGKAEARRPKAEGRKQEVRGPRSKTAIAAVGAGAIALLLLGLAAWQWAGNEHTGSELHPPTRQWD